MDNWLIKKKSSDLKDKILVGTSGFSYKHWAGTFYPDDLPGRERLSYYATKFPTVEISSTFHNFPEPRVLNRWCDSTPPGFIISLRGPEEVTHKRHLVDCNDIMSAFARRAEIVGDKLGVITFQLLESEPFDAATLKAFAAALPTGFRYSMEFRSEPWYNDEAYDILAEKDIAIVTVGHSNMGIHPKQPAAWSHIRMSGNNPDYKENSYSDEELRNWQGIIKDAAKPAFVYFNNEYKAFAAHNALKLMNILELTWEPKTAGGWNSVTPKIYGPSDGATGPNNNALPVDQRTYGPDNQVEPVRTPKRKDPWAKRPRRYKQQYPAYDPDYGPRVDRPTTKDPEALPRTKPSSY